MKNNGFRKRIFVGFSTVNRRISETKIYDVDLIKRDLLNNFMTRKGEKIMDPEYGSIIWDLLFEPFTEITKNQILSDVERIINFEPRVELLNANVYAEDHGIIVVCNLVYKPFNIVDDLYIQFSRRNFGTNISKDVLTIEDIG
ncbi:MAG: GPW/gp25 family protein [Candidatus Aenigmatarchaeota archaeon]